MRAAEQPWASPSPVELAALLADAPFRWWVAGGWAHDLATGVTRPHGDIDVAVLRSEHEALLAFLVGWDLCIAHAGELARWSSGPVGPPENAVWARESSAAPWRIDFKIELVDGDEWVYRRDARVRIPLDRLGRTTPEGVPYLVPEVVELYLSRRPSRASSRTASRPRAGRARPRRPRRSGTRRARR